jgi:mannitol-1-phosphate 5-dehydrogenase
MNPIKIKHQVSFHKIVIFGAGKIGRSFIGQLFSRGGYKVVFIDIDPIIVESLNRIRSYRIIIKGEKEEEITIQNVQALSAFDEHKVIEAISTAGILAVSVGKNSIEKIIPIIASGLKLRYDQNPNYPLDIIIAENMRAAANFIRERLIQYLPSDYPIEKLVGLIEASIGKMVRYMTLAEQKIDPLMVYAEPYNTLILDAKEFKSSIPDIKGLAPKDNIKAWVDRKAFIHNLGHATAAYYGFYHCHHAVFLYEVLDNSEICQFTRDVMLQSADIVRAAYPSDFTISDLVDHIDDLIFRFKNKALQDTLFRVGHDLVRKLRCDDRFIGAVHLAISLKSHVIRIFFQSKR